MKKEIYSWTTLGIGMKINDKDSFYILTNIPKTFFERLKFLFKPWEIVVKMPRDKTKDLLNEELFKEENKTS